MVCKVHLDSADILCRLCGISKTRRGEFVVRDITFHVSSGEVVTLMGPSGVGKTTLLEIIAGETAPSEGTVNRTATSMAYALQNTRLLPWRNSLQNVAIARELQGDTNVSACKAATAVMTELDLIRLSAHMPHELSGGMAQKVAIARTLCSNARLLLFDEPFSNMDIGSWRMFGNHIRLAAASGCGVLIVSHQIDNVVDVSDRIMLLKGSPGLMQQILCVRNGALWDESGNEITSGVRQSRDWLYTALCT